MGCCKKSRTWCFEKNVQELWCLSLTDGADIVLLGCHHLSLFHRLIKTKSIIPHLQSTLSYNRNSRPKYSIKQNWWRIDETSWASTDIWNHSVCSQSRAKERERASRAVLKYTQESRATAGQAYSCEVILALSHFHSLPIRPWFCKRRRFLKIFHCSLSLLNPSLAVSLSSPIMPPTNLPLLFSLLSLFLLPFHSYCLAIKSFLLLSVLSPPSLFLLSPPPCVCVCWLSGLWHKEMPPTLGVAHYISWSLAQRLWQVFSILGDLLCVCVSLCVCCPVACCQHTVCVSECECVCVCVCVCVYV